MKQQIFLFVSSVVLFSGCSATKQVCEDVTLASEQVQQCQALHRQIISAKQRPIIRTELERRYQQDCIETRFYRDDKQAGVCGNKDEVKQSQVTKQ